MKYLYNCDGDIVSLEDVTTTPAMRDVSKISEGYKLTGDGMAKFDSRYQLKKYAVTAGETINIVSNHLWQFQSGILTPTNSGEAQSLVGNVGDAGMFEVVVPDAAKFLTMSELIDTNVIVGCWAAVEKETSIKILSAEIDSFKSAAKAKGIASGRALAAKSVVDDKVSNWEYIDVLRADVDAPLARLRRMFTQLYASDAVADVDLGSKTLADLYDIYDSLCTAYPSIIIRGDDLGTDTAGNEIRQYIVTFNAPFVGVGEITTGQQILDTHSDQNKWDNTYCDDKKTILINTGCHGNEKTPTWGVALAIKELVESADSWSAFIKENYIISVLPCLNPYGFEHHNRYNANGADINRDIGSWEQAESVAWKSWIDTNKNNAIVYLDCHGTSGYYAYFEALDSDPYYNLYMRVYYKFVSAIEGNWRLHFSHTNLLEQTCIFVNSTYRGTTMDYIKEQGIPGHVLETPQDLHDFRWGNWASSCKITKDMLINLIQMYTFMLS